MKYWAIKNNKTNRLIRIVGTQPYDAHKNLAPSLFRNKKEALWCKTKAERADSDLNLKATKVEILND